MDIEWIDDQLRRFDQKFKQELYRIENRIPHYAKEGIYTQNMAEEDITWWTNGFLGGILWQLSDYTSDKMYEERAEQLENQLDTAMNVFDGLHHDVGFMWLHTAVAHDRRHPNKYSKTRAMHAATLLAGRFNIKGNYLRSWNGNNQSWVIIDSLMNIPLLYWASETTDDERFSLIAKKHADTVLKNHVRPDGSVNHIVIFDEDGQFESAPGGQGYASGSAWTRGQAWAIYGFALSYKYTKDIRYLNAAKQVAHFFIANLGDKKIPVVDFRSPTEPKLYDTSAGLCAACGLLEISTHVPESEKELYYDNAARIIKEVGTHAADWNHNKDGIIGYGTGAYHDESSHHVSLIYSDYYYLEGLLRLAGKYKNMW